MNNDILILKLEKSQKDAKYSLPFLCAICCFLVSISFLVESKNTFLWWSFIVLSSVCISITTYAWFVRKQFIRLDKNGITLGTLFKTLYFDWKYIQDVKSFKYNTNEKVGLVFNSNFSGPQISFSNKYSFLKHG